MELTKKNDEIAAALARARAHLPPAGRVARWQDAHVELKSVKGLLALQKQRVRAARPGAGQHMGQHTGQHTGKGGGWELTVPRRGRRGHSSTRGGILGTTMPASTTAWSRRCRGSSATTNGWPRRWCSASAPTSLPSPAGAVPFGTHASVLGCSRAHPARAGRAADGWTGTADVPRAPPTVSRPSMQTQAVVAAPAATDLATEIAEREADLIKLEADISELALLFRDMQGPHAAGRSDAHAISVLAHVPGHGRPMSPFRPLTTSLATPARFLAVPGHARPFSPFRPVSSSLIRKPHLFCSPGGVAADAAGHDRGQRNRGGADLDQGRR